MTGRSITDADARRNRAAAQRRIKRRCSCGRVITGNAAWWSHSRKVDGTERPLHRYEGRA